MLFKHLHTLLSTSGLHRLFPSLIYEPHLLFLSSSSLLLCFVSMRVSLGAPDNTLILLSSSKFLSVCNNLMPLFLDYSSENLLRNKFEDANTYDCQQDIYLLIFAIFSTSLKQSVNIKSFVAYTNTTFGFIFLVNFFFSEPIFVDAHVIPDGTDPNDAKIYFFFKERLTDNSGSTKQIHSMIARVCPVRTILFTRLLG